MNERLTVLAGGLLALLLVYVLLVPKQNPMPPLSRPTSRDSGPNGYMALQQWLERAGLRTLSLRLRFDALASSELNMPKQGNILLVSMPHLSRPRFDEIHKLRQWVVQGNTLVIVAAINDVPAWALRSDQEFFREDLESITLATFVDPDTDNSKSLKSVLVDSLPVEKTILNVRPSLAHPLFEGVDTLYGESDFGLKPQKILMGEHAPLLELASGSQTELGILWEQRRGSGRIILSAYSSLFSNRAIGKLQNRNFVGNLLRYHLAPDGFFIFDDMHQGLSELYDPKAFFADSRLHYSLYFIVAFWLLYLIGFSNRLGGPNTAVPIAGEEDFVRAIGRFFARQLEPAEAARRMFEKFFNDIRRQRSMRETGEPIWDVLDRSPLVRKEKLDELRKAYTATQAGRKLSLIKLHNQINTLRKALA